MNHTDKADLFRNIESKMMFLMYGIFCHSVQGIRGSNTLIFIFYISINTAVWWTWLLHVLTFITSVRIDVSEAKGSTGCVRTLNDDVTKFLRRHRTEDGNFVVSTHCIAVLSANRVRLLKDWSLLRWVLICQSDHKVVQTRCYITEQTTGRPSY